MVLLFVKYMLFINLFD